MSISISNFLGNKSRYATLCDSSKRTTEEQAIPGRFDKLESTRVMTALREIPGLFSFNPHLTLRGGWKTDHTPQRKTNPLHSYALYFYI